MFSKLFYAFAILVAVVSAAKPAVFTQEKIVHELIATSPFITDTTTTIVWTASATSITTTQPPLPVTTP
ncbi:hypothetical protein NP233_g5441 [Leucocoprinus birnbaumii]|uniref:Uncharacterized protein n=1 Tax=Leucocoprinus birnbaumii TaxID=56174 RepID=A0AAD5VVH9_9AGAR|nr:hypothetical protein NP233_g10252 [Leucocoprinus birnbaumii]KAJ3568847.1 hypothetical protein NP233_g5441 [Leucocoprinus birnbaumii]